MMNVSNETREFIVDGKDATIRVDKYLSLKTESFTRNYLQKLIKENLVLVNSVPVKSNYKVMEGDLISFEVPRPVPLDVLPENIPLSILYEDEDIIVIDKPKNMVVHPAPGHYTGTIVNALLYHCKGNLSGINGVMRPGIVHRIDRDTTGVIVICKNDKAHNSLAWQLKEHSITRCYEAIVYNHLKDTEGIINAPIGRHPVERKKMTINYKNGKEAMTHYQLIENINQNLAYVRCKLDTGRTHQIRVHMASINHPILGDVVYGPSKSKFHLEGQTLHARVLGFIHPSKGVYMEFESPLPDYFQDLLKKFYPFSGSPEISRRE